MIVANDLTSVKNADKALFFMTKQGCSNCAQVKPMIEKFETENPDVLVFTHEATDKDDPILKEFPPIRMFPGVFCLKGGKVVSQTNAIPEPATFTVGLASLPDKLANFGLFTRRIAALENELKVTKEFCTFLDTSISLEEVPTPVEEFPLPTETTTTTPVESCESCT